MSADDIDAALRQQIEREVATWPPLSAEQESAVGVIFASGKAMQESGSTTAA